jgi:hypothetical protein
MTSQQMTSQQMTSQPMTSDQCPMKTDNLQIATDN